MHRGERMNPPSRVSFALLFFLISTWAQNTPFEGRTITQIVFSPRQPLAPADLARIMPMKTGEALHSEDVATAIDALFATGRFQDIVVEAEPAGNGVTVRFVTQLARFVGNVAIEGKIAQIQAATDPEILKEPFEMAKRDPELIKAAVKLDDAIRNLDRTLSS